jgi:hypothetical protein
MTGFEVKLAAIDAGKRVVVGDAFMDWADRQGRDIRTARNAAQVGTSDCYVAFIQAPKGMAYDRDGFAILTGEYI